MSEFVFERGTCAVREGLQRVVFDILREAVYRHHLARFAERRADARVEQWEFFTAAQRRKGAN